MTLHRRAAKRDGNEPAVIDALEKLGILVQRISAEDFADLICFDPRTRTLTLIDVKNPDGKNRVSEGQLEKARVWPIHFVRSDAEALALFSVREESQ